jgi:hypothetical protein
VIVAAEAMRFGSSAKKFHAARAIADVVVAFAARSYSQTFSIASRA